MDAQFISGLYNKCQALARLYPELFSLDVLPMSSTAGAPVYSFTAYSGKIGSVELICFEANGYSVDDTVVDYRMYCFLNFFSRFEYVDKLSRQVSPSGELLIIMAWAEFIFWHSPKDETAKITPVSRDAYDYVWLAGAEFKLSQKLELVLNGLYKPYQVEMYKEVPDFYVRAVLDLADFDSAFASYRAPLLSLRTI